MERVALLNPPPQRLWRETEGEGLESVSLLNPPPCVQNERFRGGRFGGGDNKRAFFPVIPHAALSRHPFTVIPCAVRRISASRDLKAGVVPSGTHTPLPNQKQ